MLSRSLRYFLEVARCGSLREASEHLRITISALSRQVASLEDHIGVTLFERTAHGMVLTQAGRLLQDYASRTASEAERLAAVLRHEAAARSRQIRLVTSDGLSHLATELAGLAQADAPGLEVTLHVAPSEDVARLVQNGTGDLGLTFGTYPDQDLDLLGSWPTDVLVIMRAGHPASERREMTIGELFAFDLALPENTSLGRLIGTLGLLRPRQDCSTLLTNSLSCLLRHVEGSDALGLLSAVTLQGRLDTDRFACARLSAPGIPGRVVTLYARRDAPIGPIEAGLARRIVERLDASTA